MNPTSRTDDVSWSPQGPPALTKVDIAYRRIRQEIVEGALAAGTAVDQEALAARLGLSTTPVREALRRLESESLIVNRPHRQTEVAPLTLQLLEDAYAVRLVLDPLAASLAAQHATEDQIQRIARLCQESQSRPEADAVWHLYQNRRFHRAIYSSCGNDILIQMLETLWDRTDRYRLAILREDSTMWLAYHEHSAIVTAIVARDGDKASELMTEHLLKSVQMIRDLPPLNS
jgi:DNA-binding GntR family transcriptional regulator